MIELEKYNTIILDLGGVIIDIYPHRVVEALSKVSLRGKTSEEIYGYIRTNRIVERHEVGELTDNGFLNEIGHFINCFDLNLIERAWCNMLGEIPRSRIDVIEGLKKTHQVFLLSNTNAIHFSEIENYLRVNHGTSIYHLFDQVFLSHEIGLRKPDKEIYKQIVLNLGHNPDRSIFIDDVMENSNAAELVGIKGFHLDLENYKLDQIFNYE